MGEVTPGAAGIGPESPITSAQSFVIPNRARSPVRYLL